MPNFAPTASLALAGLLAAGLFGGMMANADDLPTPGPSDSADVTPTPTEAPEPAPSPGSVASAPIAPTGGPVPATTTTHGNSFSSPEILTGYWPTVLFDSAAATTQSGEPRRVGTSRYLRRTMWAKWTAPQSGFVSFSLWSTGVHYDTDDTGINVYTGSKFSTLKRVATNDDQYLFPDGSAGSSTAPGVWSGILGMQVIKGTKYYIQVGSATDSSATSNADVPGFLSLRLAIDKSNYIEPNDNLAKATTLTLGTGATVTTDAYVNGSTMESWEPSNNVLEPAAKRIGSVWYKWSAPQNGLATLTICAYNERMSLAVFENWNSDPGVGLGDMSATTFAFDTSVCSGGKDAATATFTARKGVTYFLQVAKTVPLYGDSGGEDKYGTLTLSVVFSALYIEKISPTSGSTGGGTSVTFTGQNFATGMIVHFGSKSVSAPAGTTPTSFTVKAPSHSAGKVSVTLSLASDTSNAKSYTYK